MGGGGAAASAFDGKASKSTEGVAEVPAGFRFIVRLFIRSNQPQSRPTLVYLLSAKFIKPSTHIGCLLA